MPATGVHFNGSVNLPDAETVMRTGRLSLAGADLSRRRR
jgi:hypothetical protein